ncbi:hypothetical protein D3C87_1653690 [compost metagenome]
MAHHGRRKAFHNIPAVLLSQRHHHVKALSTTGLQPPLQAEPVQEDAHQLRSLLNCWPGHTFPGIQVQDQSVGLLDSVLHRVPRVKFDHVHLRGRHDCGWRRHFEQGGVARMKPLWQGGNPRDRGVKVLLEEELSLNADRRTHEGDRPGLQVRHEQGRHQAVVACEVQLRQACRGVDDAIRIG